MREEYDFTNPLILFSFPRRNHVRLFPAFLFSSHTIWRSSMLCFLVYCFLSDCERKVIDSLV
jgi:hypothetical protein